MLLIVFAALRGGEPAHMAAAMIYTASALFSNIWPPRSTTRFSPLAPSACFASSIAAASTYSQPAAIRRLPHPLANDGGAVLFFAVWAIAIIGIALECFMRERQPHWVSG